MPTLEELLGSLGGLGRQAPQMPVNAQTPPFVPSPAPPMAPPQQPDPFAMLMSLGNTQAQPEPPKTKRQQIGMAIGDFLQSIGAGLANRGKAGQSTGAGAAMQTPFLLAQQRRQQAEQQELQRQAMQKQKYDQMLQAINARMMQQRANTEQQMENRLGQPAPPQPFNLGPGQVRFGPDGKPIASVPPTPPPPAPGFNLGPGQTRYGPDGKPIASIPSAPPPPAPGFNLSPGQTRFDSQGKPIASIPAAPPAAGSTSVDNTGQYSEERANRTIQSVEELLPKVNNLTVGYGSLLKNWPATAANNFRSELDTLKANIGFNELTAMRAASKTGGALGNVSDRELTLLTSALGALEQSQDVASVKANLNKVKASVERWKNAVAGQTKVIGDQTYEKVEGGWRLKK